MPRMFTLPADTRLDYMEISFELNALIPIIFQRISFLFLAMVYNKFMCTTLGFVTQFCVKPYVPRESRRDPSNRRLNEHEKYIRHRQESNLRPAPPQAGADPIRSQWPIDLASSNQL